MDGAGVDNDLPKHILRDMSADKQTTTISVKTEKSVKKLAELRARQLGIPLGALVNAFLRNLGQTGEVHFSVADPMTPQMVGLLREMRDEIARGDTDGPFRLDEAEEFLDSIAHEHQD